jgi:hypothetical protein
LENFGSGPCQASTRLHNKHGPKPRRFVSGSEHYNEHPLLQIVTGIEVKDGITSGLGMSRKMPRVLGTIFGPNKGMLNRGTGRRG